MNKYTKSITISIKDRNWSFNLLADKTFDKLHNPVGDEHHCAMTMSNQYRVDFRKTDWCLEDIIHELGHVYKAMTETVTADLTPLQVEETMCQIMAKNYFDIGRTLDKNLSGTKFYREELSKVPDGQILIAQHGWEWASITPHNREYGTNIIGVSLETLASPVYQKWLIENGIKFDKFEDASAYMVNTYIAQSIIEKNENVWITKETDKSTYGAEVVKTTSSDIDLPRVMYDKKDLYVWRWIPDNPYLAITGQIEVEKWKNIVMSNYNMVFFGMLGVIGFVPYWILQQIIVKKKKWSLNGRSIKNECS